jgi:4-alpha-glucanotransferase
MDDRGSEGLSTSILHRLAARIGVERGYVDALGTRRELSDDQLRTILSALGLAVQTEEDTARSLSAYEETPWRRALAPVQVASPAPWPARVPVTLPAQSTSVLHWRVEQEGGASHSGKAEWNALPVLAETSLDGTQVQRRLLDLNVELPEGYHRLTLREGSAEMALIVAPPRCHAGPASPSWGLAVQLYGLRREDDWGIGDFGSLAQLAETAAALGAHFIGLNPLHALFPCDPSKFSPYSPSSRSWLNILYIDVAALAELQDCPDALLRVADPEFQNQLATLRAAELVDYPGVTRAKLEILELIWENFAARHLDQKQSQSGQAFSEFVQKGGASLWKFALFEALAEHFVKEGKGAYWAHWPEPYRDPTSTEVAEFAEQQRDRVLYWAWLQWQADRQLGAAAAACRNAGMKIGLYADLAVGVDSGGAEAWGNPELLVRGASAGAPPDLWNMLGQDWGLPPWSPIALRNRAYRPFIELLRANMKHAAALRLDHIMALMRLYWVPAGEKADAGGYVAYPFDDLLALLALESRRNNCIVVGEALGTVPAGFAERLQETGIFSYRLLYFERALDGEFLPPTGYPHASMVAITTHDLATFPGYWAGRDLQVKSELKLFPNEERRKQAFDERERDRRHLVEALEREAVLDTATALRAVSSEQVLPDLIEAAYHFLGRSTAQLLTVQIEDALGLIEQANVPGTITEHPNWRRRLPATVSDLAHQPLLRQIATHLGRLRS